MVARYWSNRTCSRVCHVAFHATVSRHGRVSGISVLFQNPGAAFAGALSRVRQRGDLRWDETRPGWRDAWRRPLDRKLRMATGLLGNRSGESRVVARLDEVDAAGRDTSAAYWTFSPCN